LRKLAFENIFVVVCLWHQKVPGTVGPHIYRLIIDEARVLSFHFNEILGITENYSRKRNGG
jgi:hypothetical protein